MIVDNQEVEVRVSTVIPDLKDGIDFIREQRKECAIKARRYGAKKKLQLQVFFLCDIVDVLCQVLKTKGIIEESDITEVESLIDKIDELEIAKKLFTY